jgi:hypothetical protein
MILSEGTEVRRRGVLVRSLLSIIAAAAALTVLPAAASATDVEFRGGKYVDVFGDEGLANQIRIDFADGRLRVKDYAAPVHDGRAGDDPQCERRSENELLCPVGSLKVYGGGGDDSITLALGCCTVNINPNAGRDRVRLIPSASRSNLVFLELADGEAGDRVTCTNSRRVQLRPRNKDRDDDIDNCPGRRG